ncbi:MAG TPA: hypothetical protein VIR16_09520 [Candidatus Limnocylindrales bacterium]
MPEPVEIQYFYKTRWGAHDEWLELFLRNHWPILREQMAQGRYTAVRMVTPRFHGEGLAGWDVMVSITYRDWNAVQEHSDPTIVGRLYPDQATFRAEERRRFELLESHWDVVLEEQALT